MSISKMIIYCSPSSLEYVPKSCRIFYDPTPGIQEELINKIGLLEPDTGKRKINATQMLVEYIDGNVTIEYIQYPLKIYNDRYIRINGTYAKIDNDGPTMLEFESL